MTGTQLELSEKFSNDNIPDVINVELTREDLAHISKMTTENASRTISPFRKDSIVQTRGKTIKIVDRKKPRKAYLND